MAVLHTNQPTSDGQIIYRWLRSDGYVSDPISVSGDGRYPATWDINAADGDGSTKWVQLEVLSPNHLLSERQSVTLECQFAIHQTSASASPTHYDCQVGGDQAFTFTGVIQVFAAPGAHTVTYHWRRSDGTAQPDQTITVPAGAASVTVQPDVWTIQQTAPGFGGGYGDEIIVTSPTPTGASYPVAIEKLCG